MYLQITTFLIALISFVYSNDWFHITSHLDVTDIVSNNDYIYASTHGGLLILNKESHQLLTLNANEGIYPADLKSIFIDYKNNILLGSNGPIPSIQVIDSDYNHINTVFLNGIDGLNQIVDIVEYNNDIYAIGRGGDIDMFIHFKYDNQGHLYYQTVLNLPIQNISTIYDLDIVNEEIFITTNRGIVKGATINDEIVWVAHDLIDMDKVFFYNGHLFNDEFRSESIIDVISSDVNQFNIATVQSLYRVSDSDTVKIFDCPYESANFSNIYQIGNTIVLSVENMGIYSLLMDNNTIIDKNMYLPGTILQNNFSSITVTDNGQVVAVSENGGAIIKDERITNFVPYNKKKYYPVNNYISDIVLDFNRYGNFDGFSTNYRSGSQSPMSITSSDWNSIYFTNPGITSDINNIFNSPLIEISLDNYDCFNYGIGDDVIDGMDGIVDIESVDSGYMFINYLRQDSQNNIWVLNPYAEKYNNIIAVQSPNKTWSHLKDSYGLNLSDENNSLLPTTFDFDPLGRVWVSFRRHLNQNGEVVSSGGIKILDFNNTINDLSDDQWLEIENPEILPNGISTEIWSLAFSKNLNENILWILTGNGVKGYIINDLELIEYPQTFYENIYFDESDKLKVDSQNNLWIITRHSGVRVISQDTSTWPSANGITTDNSPILSNVVYDVAFNTNNGKIYFATEKGISIMNSPFTQNPITNDNEEISLSPNPLKLSSDNSLSIWNIFPGSKIRIMTLNGTVLKTFELNNNENKIYSWDGILNSGDYIKPGIYLITASHANYASRIGKLAVTK